MTAKDILHKHNLIRTSCRQAIIDTLANAGAAISEEEIKQIIGDTYDRTTLYRTFKTLIENGIIHKIVVDNQLVKYALSASKSVSENHVHFYCNKCGLVECLSGAGLTIPDLPDGYSQTNAELIIKGNCKNCNR
jgi:Fur family ferric uptake transcriptional regulator